MFRIFESCESFNNQKYLKLIKEYVYRFVLCNHNSTENF